MPRRWVRAAAAGASRPRRSYSSAASVALIGGVAASATRASARAVISSAERRPTKVPASAISAAGVPVASRSSKPQPAGWHRRTAGEPVEKGAEPRGTPDVAEKGGLASFGGIQPANGGHQDADVAGHRTQVQIGQKVAEQGEDLGIRDFRGGAVEDLVADLQVLAGPARAAHLLAENLAQIGIAGGVGAVGHVGLHDRHGEVGAQHHLALEGVVGDIGAGADILAVEVQKGAGGLQDIGLDRHGTGGDEGGKQPLALGADGGLGGITGASGAG